MTLFISLKSSLLNNVIIHSKLKKILHLKSHKNIIFFNTPQQYINIFSLLKPKSLVTESILRMLKISLLYTNFIHFFVSIVLNIFLQRVLFLYQVLYIERLLCLIHCTYLNNKRNKLNKYIKHSFIPPYTTPYVYHFPLYSYRLIDP